MNQRLAIVTYTVEHGFLPASRRFSLCPTRPCVPQRRLTAEIEAELTTSPLVPQHAVAGPHRSEDVVDHGRPEHHAGGGILPATQLTEDACAESDAHRRERGPRRPTVIAPSPWLPPAIRRSPSSSTAAALSRTRGAVQIRSERPSALSTRAEAVAWNPNGLPIATTS